MDLTAVVASMAVRISVGREKKNQSTNVRMALYDTQSRIIVDRHWRGDNAILTGEWLGDGAVWYPGPVNPPWVTDFADWRATHARNLLLSDLVGTWFTMQIQDTAGDYFNFSLALELSVPGIGVLLANSDRWEHGIASGSQKGWPRSLTIFLDLVHA
jgi:hypothetical protein